MPRSNLDPEAIRTILLLFSSRKVQFHIARKRRSKLQKVEQINKYYLKENFSLTWKNPFPVIDSKTGIFNYSSITAADLQTDQALDVGLYPNAVDQFGPHLPQLRSLFRLRDRFTVRAAELLREEQHTRGLLSEHPVWVGVHNRCDLWPLVISHANKV